MKKVLKTALVMAILVLCFCLTTYAKIEGPSGTFTSTSSQSKPQYTEKLTYDGVTKLGTKATATGVNYGVYRVYESEDVIKQNTNPAYCSERYLVIDWDLAVESGGGALKVVPQDHIPLTTTNINLTDLEKEKWHSIRVVVDLSTRFYLEGNNDETGHYATTVLYCDGEEVGRGTTNVNNVKENGDYKFHSTEKSYGFRLEPATGGITYATAGFTVWASDDAVDGKSATPKSPEALITLGENATFVGNSIYSTSVNSVKMSDVVAKDGVTLTLNGESANASTTLATGDIITAKKGGFVEYYVYKATNPITNITNWSDFITGTRYEKEIVKGHGGKDANDESIKMIQTAEAENFYPWFNAPKKLVEAPGYMVFEFNVYPGLNMKNISFATDNNYEFGLGFSVDELTQNEWNKVTLLLSETKDADEGTKYTVKTYVKGELVGTQTVRRMLGQDLQNDNTNYCSNIRVIVTVNDKADTTDAAAYFDDVKIYEVAYDDIFATPTQPEPGPGTDPEPEPEPEPENPTVGDSDAIVYTWDFDKASDLSTDWKVLGTTTASTDNGILTHTWANESGDGYWNEHVKDYAGGELYKMEIRAKLTGVSKPSDRSTPAFKIYYSGYDAENKETKMSEVFGVDVDWTSTQNADGTFDSDWQIAEVDLSAMNGFATMKKITNIRFRAAKNSKAGKIEIDYIKLYSRPGVASMTYNGGTAVDEGVPIDARTIELTLTDKVLSIPENAVSLLDEDGGTTALSSVKYDATTGKLTLTPADKLFSATNYTIVLNSDVKVTATTNLFGSLKAKFTTKSADVDFAKSVNESGAPVITVIQNSGQQRTVYLSATYWKGTRYIKNKVEKINYTSGTNDFTIDCTGDDWDNIEITLLEVVGKKLISAGSKIITHEKN